ncbi:hypothetical protein [Oceanobacillus rekensis]|nr:hypothetical protein [Oceanobacillus rekensis]
MTEKFEAASLLREFCFLAGLHRGIPLPNMLVDGGAEFYSSVFN